MSVCTCVSLHLLISLRASLSILHHCAASFTCSFRNLLTASSLPSTLQPNCAEPWLEAVFEDPEVGKVSVCVECACRHFMLKAWDVGAQGRLRLRNLCCTRRSWDARRARSSGCPYRFCSVMLCLRQSLGMHERIARSFGSPAVSPSMGRSSAGTAWHGQAKTHHDTS